MSSEREVTLSYVLTTYNKLRYLRVTLPDLIEACDEDEEIVIFDGGSTDGTVAYLQQLHEAGKIHQFYSERDFGEANGYNKAMTVAKGAILKIISDDDAYDYDGIKCCKEFMLKHPEVHLVGADGFGVNNLLQHNVFSQRSAINDFTKWKETKKPFLFCGLSILLRKDAIPLLGLWNTNYLIIDFEYTLRVTSSKATIGWLKKLVYVNIVNERSNSGNNWKRMEIEKEKLDILYFGKRPILSFESKDKLKNILRPIKYKLFPQKISNPIAYEDIYKKSKNLLKEANHSLPNEVLI